MDEEFFLNEHPDAPKEPEWKEVSGGGGGAHWVEWATPGGEPPVPDPPEWGSEEEYLPFLKRSPDGWLLTDGVSPELLTGSQICQWPPHLIAWISGDGKREHTRCLLVRTSDGRRLDLDRSPQLAATQRERGITCIGNLDWIHPGKFEIQAKWQAGHYDHAKINSARFAAFGVDAGFRVLPLKTWVTVLAVKVTEDYEIYVDNIRGTLGGNNQFWE
ncbi:MAG: hypothetical protein V8T90_05205 [Victivallales bacterium]